VKRCLAKDPDERWQSARDLKWALESGITARPAASSRSRYTMLLVGWVVAALLVATFAFVRFREQPSPRYPIRMSILLPEKSRPMSLAVSPDGRTIAMVLVKEGKQQIWVRALDALEPTPLAGTDDAADLFWSPDNRFIGFFADAKLKKVDRSGGPVQTLCDALAARGGTWNQNGNILFGGLVRVERVSDAGGAVTDLPNRVTELYPFFLPDGRHYLGTREAAPGSTGGGIWLSSMDNPESRQILPDVSNAELIEPPAGSEVGNVLFTRAGTLMALPFDLKRLQAAGDAFPIGQKIVFGIPPYWLAATSRDGVLAYASGESGVWQYVWRDRQGKKLGVINGAGSVVMISPDGKRLTGDREGDTWVLEFARGTAIRLAGLGNFNPIWSPDGRYVAYDKLGVGIYRKRADGSGAEELLVAAKGLAVPKSWSPDGQFIIYAQVNPGTGADLLGIRVEPDPKPFALAQTPATEDQGQFSPDGHWVAYTSNESAVSEIYVIPFPPSSNGGKWLVSRRGGVMPRWQRDGKELFYISPDSKMMAVPVRTHPVFQSGTPRALFHSEIVDTGIRTGPLSWDLSPDGKRFLIISPSPTEEPSLTVALNWRDRQLK
jgi:Tol biopolymer transport system component